MDIPIYNMVFDEDDKGGLFGISLVNTPANMVDFVTLSKDFIKLRTKDKKKQIVSGVVLIPNQKIYRNDPKYGEHFITFNEETIEKLCYTFLGSDYIKNSWYNHNHKEKLNPVIVESWIINDPNIDKSVSLGFEDLPKGTWMMSMKLSNDEWNNYVETGKVKGYSIDAYLERELILKSNIKKENKMENIMKRLITMLKKHTGVKLATINVGDNELEAEAFEEGNVVTKDGEPYSNQKFDYDGYTYTTDDEGVITSVVQIEEEDVEVELDEKDDEIEEVVDEVAEEEGVDADDLPVEVIIEIVREVIEDEPELDEYLRNHYLNEDKDKEDEEDIQLKLDNLFSKEREIFNKTIAKLKEDIVKLNKELEITPSTTKLSANGGNNVKHKHLETELEAIERIVQMGKNR